MSYRLLSLPALLLGATLAAGPVLAQQGQQSGSRVWISPTQGPTLTVIRLFAKDLPGLTEVAILGGPDPERLQPIGTAQTDAEGGLGVQFKVPEEAERGEPFYFAVDPEGEAALVLAEPPFRVLVRENVAPGGA